MATTLAEYTHLCSELVTFSVAGGVSTPPLTVVGNLEEIGEWKARVLLDRPAPRGAQASLNAGNHCLRGTVRSWMYEPGLGYLVDVQLETRWTPAWFQPEHMLSIGELAGEAASAAA